MERQQQLINLQETAFRSSAGIRVPQEKIRAMCGDCQHIVPGNQCRIMSPVSQADNTGLQKCELKRP